MSLLSRPCLSEYIRSPGANPWRIVDQIRHKLRMGAAAVHVPLGLEDRFKGVVDLVRWKAVYNEGIKGYFSIILPNVNMNLWASPAWMWLNPT
jgi:elongation factor G